MIVNGVSTTIKAGMRLRWTQRNAFSGEVLRTVDCVAHGEPFEIKRSGWESKWVVRLTCNRLASLEDLEPFESSIHPPVVRAVVPVPAKQETAQLSDRSERPVAGSAESGKASPAASPEKEHHEQQKTPATETARTGEKPGHRQEISTEAKARGVRTAAVDNNCAEASRRELSVNDSKPAHESSRDRDTKTNGLPVHREDRSGSACKVLAVDFLNVLVRAFHAGKPTETHAVRSMFQTVANAVRSLRPERIVFAMDGGHAHRTALLPTYKAHRPPAEPLLVAQRELAEKALNVAGFQTIRVQDFEADDVLASIATANPGTVIVSSDKDLLALCGIARVYHPWGAGEFVTAESKLGLPAGQVTDYLALCGDSSDGIPGVKGIGPKTALELLTEFDSLESILIAATLGQIKGAKGVTLKERRDEALKSRQLVELRASLPLPELRPWHHPLGCQQTLQSMGLGSVAAILDSLQNMPPVQVADPVTPKTVAPAAVKKPASKSLFEDDEETPNPVACAQSAGIGKPERATADEIDRTQPDNSSGPESETLDRPVTSTDSAGRVINPLSLVTRFEMDIECLMVLSDQNSWATDEASAVTCWHAGRAARNRDVPNPWKVNSWNFVAWDQGFHGVPLSVEF